MPKSGSLLRTTQVVSNFKKLGAQWAKTSVNTRCRVATRSPPRSPCPWPQGGLPPGDLVSEQSLEGYMTSPERGEEEMGS